MHMLSQQYVQLSFSLANKPGLYSLHTGAILAVNAIAIVPLVLWLGLIGAAVSFLLAEIFGVAFGLLLAHRTYPLPLIPGRAARIVLATAGMGLVAFGVQRLLGRVDVIGLTAIVAAAGLTYVALLIALDIFEARRRLTDHVLPRLRREVRR
jgi:O-antigen/teichoic acid export membrane protein